MAHLHVAYVLLRFPFLTETFIAEEMRHIQRKGIRLHLYSLLRSRDELVHPVSQELLPHVHYAPGVLSVSLWLAQAWWLLTAPGKYLGLLARVLREPAPHASFLVKRWMIFLKSVWLARELRRGGVQLVHAHFAWLPGLAALVAGRLLGIPFTVTAHAYDIYSERNDLLKFITSCAEQVVTISEANQRAILDLNPGLLPSKVSVLRCGIDLDRFRPPAGKRPGAPLQITSVGSLTGKKGHEYLVRACAALKARQVDFHCTIVGRGELEQPLASLISELGLQEQVSLAGPQSQQWVRDRLALSDMFVLACVGQGNEVGDRDGLPVAIMEALAMGVPVISTAVSGIPELVRNEETGLLVAERDAQALAAAMMRLAGDEALRLRLAANGRRLVAAEYDIDRNAGRLQQLFEASLAAEPELVEAVA